jgi:hypothetical protein
VKTPRATFSKEEDLKITSLQKKHGNQWKLITERINETFETEWSNEQVRRWFLQLEIERKQGGRKLRRVDFLRLMMLSSLLYVISGLRRIKPRTACGKLLSPRCRGRMNTIYEIAGEVSYRSHRL